MQQFLITNYFAATEAAGEQSGGLLGALGIDFRLLILQILAFLVLAWALKKWVFPILLRAIDERQEAMEAGLKASQEAQAQAAESEKKVAAELKSARKQADEMLEATQKEAAALLAEAEEKAARRAEAIVNEARADMTTQLNAARESLKQETLELITRATEEIIGEKVDAKKDAQLVSRAIDHAKEQK